VRGVLVIGVASEGQNEGKVKKTQNITMATVGLKTVKSFMVAFDHGDKTEFEDWISGVIEGIAL
jgi:hypothetical protein